jgi:FtsP/CotA-like multicopper oxidase with cupredoxin domain
MRTRKLRRRDFLKSIPWATAAGWAGLKAESVMAQKMGGGMGGGGMGGGGMGGGGMGGGGTVINPPISGPFQDPLEMPVVIDTISDPKHRILTVNLTAQLASVNVNNKNATLMTYNGCFPGPTIRAQKGDILKIDLNNALPYTTQTNLLGFQRNITNLHTHGFHVSPKPPSDYVMYGLESGETYHHVYDTSLHEAGTLNFYHPHKHGVVAEQFWAGLIGALVLEDDNDVLADYETHLVILKDISLSGAVPAPHSMMQNYMQGKEGDIVMVNGQVNPRLNIKKGQVQRWRILNASNARFYRLSLEGHSMHLIGTDGGLLDVPYPQSELLLSPGERVDVLVKANNKTANYRLLALPYARMGMMTSPTITLMTMAYNGTFGASQSLPPVINPAAEMLDPGMLPIAATRDITLSMGMGRGYINGQDFDVDPFMFMSEVGTYEIWNVINNSNMDHPFHQHVNHGQVLEIVGGDPNYAALYPNLPARKDVVLVPKGGSVKLLIPVMDYDGMAMFHCHILEHEDIGMMGMWDMMDMDMPPMPM